MKLAGIDIGGTKIEAALFSGNVIIKKVRRKIEAEKGRKAVLKNIIDAVTEVFEPGVAAIGVALAGVTDPEKGMMLESPHIPCLIGVPVKRILEEEFNVKVAVDNDARMFASGVQNFYKARNLVVLTLGTGIGGAAILDGELEENPRSTKKEIGHIRVRKNGRKCACGARGCLEAYASGWAIARRYEKLGGRKLSAKEIAERARQGEKTSKKVIEEARDYLAKALAIIAKKYKPEFIFVGGGVSNIKELLAGLNVIKPKIKNAALLGAAMRARLACSESFSTTVRIQRSFR